MPEYWNLKIVADSEDEVRSVLAETAALLGIEPLKAMIALYPKFPRMWECRFETREPASDPLQACAERFAVLATPTWENTWRDSNRVRARECYEAISDSRRHLFAVNRVFWAHVVCQVRAPRESGLSASELLDDSENSE